MEPMTDLLLTRETLGKNIRARRKELNLTLEEVAKRIDKTPGFLALIERGRRSISIKSLRILSDLLDVSMDDLFEKPGEIT